MAVKALIFGVDDLYPRLKNFYDLEVQRGSLEIVGYAALENDGVKLLPKMGGGDINFQIAIISSANDFYRRMKFLEAQGVPRKNIIDGRVFQIPGFDFPRLLSEGVAYGIGNKSFVDNTMTIYPRIYRIQNNGSILKFGTKSYIAAAKFDGVGLVNVENFSSIAWSIIFNLGNNGDHNHNNISSYGLCHLDWRAPREFFPPAGVCQINIGNDVWIGRGSILKNTNPARPLIIGDGAVIASDSVVVKNVPPYAIVGGNPARLIKYRFSEDIIAALLRIKWWDWDIDKIYENFKYFNRVEEFVARNDKGV